MVDDESDQSGPKPCLHVTETNEFNSAPIRVMQPSTGDTNIPLKNVTVSMIEGLMSSPIGTASEIPWNNLAFKAWNAMRPRIRPGTSLINFVLELHDLKSWAKVGSALERIRGTATENTNFLSRKARRKWGQSLPYSDLSYKMPGGRLKMLKDIVKRLTGAHLEASFGIVPFTADIVETYVALCDLTAKVETLKRYAGRRQKRYFRRRFEDLPDLDPGFAPGAGWQDLDPVELQWPSGYNTQFRPLLRYRSKWQWNIKPVYTACIEYTYSIPRLWGITEKVDSYLDALGVRLDPSIIWNAIPYSFLVDWVADVGGFLRSFARDNFPITIQAVSMTHSVSYRYEGEISVDFHSLDRSAFFPVPTWWYDSKEYTELRSMNRLYAGSRTFYDRRLVENPQALHPTISVHLPDVRQALLSGSLFLNKRVGGRGPRRVSTR
jgi:hypothetical protein